MSVQANSVLTAITGPAPLDDYMQPTGSGTALWTGRAPAYLKRARRGGQDQGVERKGATDTLYVLDTTLAPVLEQAGRSDEATTVTVEDQRTSPPTTTTFTVLGAEHRAVGLSVDNVRLDLDRGTA